MLSRYQTAGGAGAALYSSCNSAPPRATASVGARLFGQPRQPTRPVPLRAAFLAPPDSPHDSDTPRAVGSSSPRANAEPALPAHSQGTADCTDSTVASGCDPEMGPGVTRSGATVGSSFNWRRSSDRAVGEAGVQGGRGAPHATGRAPIAKAHSPAQAVGTRTAVVDDAALVAALGPGGLLGDCDDEVTSVAHLDAVHATEEGTPRLLRPPRRAFDARSDDSHDHTPTAAVDTLVHGNTGSPHRPQPSLRRSARHRQVTNRYRPALPRTRGRGHTTMPSQDAVHPVGEGSSERDSARQGGKDAGSQRGGATAITAADDVATGGGGAESDGSSHQSEGSASRQRRRSKRVRRALRPYSPTAAMYRDVALRGQLRRKRGGSAQSESGRTRKGTTDQHAPGRPALARSVPCAPPVATCSLLASLGAATRA